MHHGKFQDGDRVRFSTTCPSHHRPPMYAIEFLRKRSRVVVRSYYDRKKQCRFYVLAGKGKGELGYHFRSYELDHAEDPNHIGRPRKEQGGF